jgi:hypothetical protein
MKTDLIQTTIAILDDDQGISALAYYNLKTLVADQLGEKVANRLGNIVNATDNRFYINMDEHRNALAVYDYITGYAQ